jgi:hypothetical protein
MVEKKKKKANYETVPSDRIGLLARNSFERFLFLNPG